MLWLARGARGRHTTDRHNGDGWPGSGTGCTGITMSGAMPGWRERSGRYRKTTTPAAARLAAQPV